jgi:septum formation protein
MTLRSPLILASTSPRRKEILNYFNLPFEAVAHTFDERSIQFSGNKENFVTQLAQEKAKNVGESRPNSVIIGADTVVFLENTILNKPKNRLEAFSMLQRLSGNVHEVLTGIALYYNGSIYTKHDSTLVFFRKLTPSQINAFLDTNLWIDKAGAYAIQGAGSLLVHRIEGCYYNVVGLPVVMLAQLLLEVGIDLWKHVKASSPSQLSR